MGRPTRRSILFLESFVHHSAERSHKNAGMEDGAENQAETAMPSSQQQDEVLKKKYGLVPKKPPLISKDHERAYFDSADWALGKQKGTEKPKGPLEALRPKLQPTQQPTRYRKSAYAPGNSEGGASDE